MGYAKCLANQLHVGLADGNEHHRNLSLVVSPRDQREFIFPNGLRGQEFLTDEEYHSARPSQGALRFPAPPVASGPCGKFGNKGAHQKLEDQGGKTQE